MEQFLVGIDEDADTLVINDRWGVSGALEVYVKKNEKPEWNNFDREFLITGVLKTELYERDLQKIESRRYVISDIDVYEENYETATDSIIYKFTSTNFRVKYNTAQVVDINELYKEQTDGEDDRA